MSDAAKPNSAAKPAAKTSADALVKADAAKPKELPAAAEKPAAGSSGGVPKEFDYAKTHEASAWKYERPLTACRFDPTGRFVFAGTEDYTIQRFHLADGKPTPLDTAHSLRFVLVGPDGHIRGLFDKDDASLDRLAAAARRLAGR